MATQDARVSATTLRLTFAVRDGQIEMIEKKSVAMTSIAEPVSNDERASISGGWVEVQDTANATLHAEDVYRLIGAVAEAFREDGSIENFTGEPTETEFEILVPALPEAASVAFFAAPSGVGAAGGAQELARFSLLDDNGGQTP